MMDVKIKYFLDKWSGDFRIEDVNESVYCDLREGLTQELLNENIVDIRLERTMWTEEHGEVVLVINR